MRVVAGIAKGRPLKTIESKLVRPTADKIKEALFAILESEAFRRGLLEPGYLADVEAGEGEVPWKRVLDLYAGSGALGIESLSRGAEWADFVEADAQARQAIGENLRRAGFSSKAKVYGTRVESALSTLVEPYDLILLDPPYNDPGVDAVLGQLCGSKLVVVSTFVVLEHSRDRKVPSECGPLSLIKTRVHGRTAISVYASRQE